ncbi:MAG: hypothetical protein Q4B88_04240 [Moraxella sp.]|nr:hypothetical protein [Moraxella sp.]
MLTLENFEKLSLSPVATKPVALQMIGEKGEKLAGWAASLPLKDKHEQYRQVKSVLGELIVADIDDELRFTMLETVIAVMGKLVSQMHAEYINNPQSPPHEQKACVEEVRSLYMLSILAYQGIAFRSHKAMSAEGLPEAASTDNKTKKTSWLSKITGNFSGNVVRNGISLDVVSGSKRLFVLSTHRVMIKCYKLLMEFALTYQKVPSSLWWIMNSWYLKAAVAGVDKLSVDKLLTGAPECSIYRQYLQSCLASTVNLFAYRRHDILNIFKILPDWVAYVKTTFTADSTLRLFVNLQANTPPEMITPYASINPYSSDYVCLFFDPAVLFEHLQKVERGEEEGISVFEKRLASIVLMTFKRHLEQSGEGRVRNQSAEVLAGFGAVFKEIAAGKNFAQVITQSKLPEPYLPKRSFEGVITQKEAVKLIRRSETGAQFLMGASAENDDEAVLSRPYLPVFGLFAMKSLQSTNKHPWRLGIVHWSQSTDEHIEVDGRFLGRLLSVCGIRLNGRDMRSKDFVPALLVAGDGLNQQTTLILPKYHFKEGDTVILRVEQKETTLRLEQNLLATDDIEQYQIVRLTG